MPLPLTYSVRSWAVYKRCEDVKTMVIAVKQLPQWPEKIRASTGIDFFPVLWHLLSCFTTAMIFLLTFLIPRFTNAIYHTHHLMIHSTMECLFLSWFSSCLTSLLFYQLIQNL